MTSLALLMQNIIREKKLRNYFWMENLKMFKSTIATGIVGQLLGQNPD
jgi:hypothetical protein